MTVKKRKKEKKDHFNSISMINKNISWEKDKIGDEERSVQFPDPNDKVRIQQN